MSNLVGAQTQWDSQEMLRYLEIVGPRYCMGINVFKRDYLEKVKARGARYIYRHHPNFDELPGLTPWFIDPELAAQEAAAFLRGHLDSVLDLVAYVVDGNEYILGPDHETPERIALADQYMAHFTRWARYALGKGSIIGNLNTGHWRKAGEIGEYFPLTLQALQEDNEAYPENGSLLGLHEYNWRLLRDDDYWRTATFLRAMPPIVEKFPLIRCLITELGIDRCADEWGADHEGWRKANPDISAAIEMFCGHYGLAWYVDRMLEAASYVEGCLIFGCGMGDWRSMGFDIMNSPEDVAVPNRIKLLPDAAPPEPPEPPNGDKPMIPERVKIYDFEHGPGDAETRDQAWLESIFGSCIDVHLVTEIHQPQPGDIVYQLQWINCKAGNASCVIVVYDEDGNPVEGETVIFGWSSADPHGYSDKGWNWTNNGAAGDTEADGHVGPGMSTDSYYSPDQGECGPHFLWIWDHPGEMVDGVGMLPFHDLVPGANHLHTEYGFRAVRWGDEPPPPVDGILDEILATVQGNQILLKEIKELLPGVPPEPPSTRYHGEYFANRELVGSPAFTREDEAILFDWGAGSPPGLPADNFSARWTASHIFEAATYRFHVVVDDGVRLWVSGQLLIDQWHDQSPTPYDATITLSAGKHTITMEYYEHGGGAVAQMWYVKL